MTEYAQIGHYAGYQLVGRTEVEPLPIDPDCKTSGRYWLFALYQYSRACHRLRRGIQSIRYGDPNRADDSRVYNNTVRRIRRLNESALSIFSRAICLGA